MLGLLLILIILFVLIISLLIFSPIIMNDIKLDKFAKQINEFSLPESTSLIDKQSVCGKLNGNGNGMDFFACILIKSDLSLDELKKYYNNEEFKTVKKRDKYGVDIDIIHANGYKLETKYLEHQSVYFSALKNKNDYNGYYVVMIYDGGYSAFFDIRGH